MYFKGVYFHRISSGKQALLSIDWVRQELIPDILNTILQLAISIDQS